MDETLDHWVKGKHILVTRPQQQSEGIAAAILSLGGTPIKFPAIDVVALAEGEIEHSKVLDVDLYDFLIVISPNAARIMLGWLDKYWPQLPSHPHWIAVGASSAEALSEAGINAETPLDTANSEGVLELSSLKNVDQLKVLLIKGEGGRNKLFDELTRRGARVSELVLYRRMRPNWDAQAVRSRIGARMPDALIATSVDILENLDALLSTLGESHRMLPLVVASDRIKSAATDLGYQRIFVAPGASDESILATLNVIG